MLHFYAPSPTLPSAEIEVACALLRPPTETVGFGFDAPLKPLTSTECCCSIISLTSIPPFLWIHKEVTGTIFHLTIVPVSGCSFSTPTPLQ